MTNRKTINFLTKRKINLATARHLEVGYFGYTHLMSRGLNYNDRMMFPIYDAYGELLAYQSRAMFNHKEYQNAPKFWHGKFDKSSTLYALYQNKEKIVEQGYAALNEGPFDVAALWEAGVGSASTLGLNLSDHHCFLLRCLTDTLVLWYDFDKAGRSGQEANVRVAKEWGFKIKQVKGTDLDPNDYLIKHGRQGLANKIRETLL